MVDGIQPDLSPDALSVIQADPLYNKDIAPTRAADRKWRLKDIAALWISMSACIPTYMLASSLIAGGMNWWQAVLTIFLGNVIVLIPMILNAHAGTKYGIPFPVYLPRVVRHAAARTSRRCCARSSPAAGSASRRGSAAGAIYKILGGLLSRRWRQRRRRRSLGINAAAVRAASCSSGRINMCVIYSGIESIRLLLNIKAPLLIALGLAAARRGRTSRRAASARCSRSRRRSIPASRRPGSSGRSSFPRSPA